MRFRSHDSAPTPPIVEAAVKGAIDVAIAWGPDAGYFARGAAGPLRVVETGHWLLSIGVWTL